MFWEFFLYLLLFSVLAPFIFSILLFPFLSLVVGVGLLKEKYPSIGKILLYPIMLVVFLAHAYVFCGWSAYISARALVYTNHPEVTHTWLYYLVGFFMCSGPLSYMAAKENDPENKNGHLLYIGLVIVAYLIFSIWPIIMHVPYGWFLGRVL